MHKRLLTSFCLLLAFAMLQAHNVIPHQHRESRTSEHLHHHQDTNHHHHDGTKNENEDDHQSPISGLTHNADFGKAIAKPHFDKQIIEKPDCFDSILSQLFDKIAVLNNSAEPHPPDHNISVHLIFLSHCLPLRAPPAL